MIFRHPNGRPAAAPVRAAAILAAAVAGAALLLAAPAGSALAATGPLITTAGQAGYAVTGAHFTTVESWVRLPDAARFASEVGQISVSAQFWTAYSVIDLRATACTDASCQPGGRPVTRRYRLQVDVYSRTTEALVCSTAASGQARCPDVPRSFGLARFAAGRTVMIALGYRIPYDQVFASVNGALYNYPVSTRSVFGQGRLGVEFGPTPWTTVPYHAPATARPLVTFDRPKPPPYAAEITTAGGWAGGIASWWADHKVTMTSDGSSAGRTEAAPSRLSDDGYRFTVYLEPAPGAAS